jgi:uncharacterized membrane protein YhaH (DUF805 family)
VSNLAKENPSLWWAIALTSIIMLPIIFPENMYLGVPVSLFLLYEYLTLLVLYMEAIEWLCMLSTGILIGYLLVLWVEKELQRISKYFYLKAIVIISLVVLIAWDFTITDAFKQLNWKTGSLYLICFSISTYGTFRIFTKNKKLTTSRLNEEQSQKKDFADSRYSLILLEGRVERTTFWMVTIPIFWASIVAVRLWGPNIEAILIVCVLIMWLQLAAFVKRLHDLGISSWFALVLFTPLHYPCLVLVGLFPGKTGINKYGEEPQ